MEAGDEQQNDKSERHEAEAGFCALNSAESHVAGSPGTGRPGDGSREAFAIAFRALLEWGEEHSLIRPQSAFSFFDRFPDGSGDEHEAWFDEASNRWLKATYPNQFGLAWGRDGSATAREYLARLVLTNKYFADDIRLVALVESSEHLRVLTSQPHIAGEAAPYEEIKQWFAEYGFVCLQAAGRIAWYRPQENLLVADAHEGNVIKTSTGILVPIDLNVMQPAGSLLEWALRESRAQA